MVISEPPDRPLDVGLEPRLAFSASAVLEKRGPTTDVHTDPLSGIGSSTSKASSSSSSIGSAHPSLDDALSLDDDSDLSQKDDEKKELAIIPQINPFLLPRSPARLFMGGLVTSAMSSVTSSKSPSLATSKAPSIDLMAQNVQDDPSELSEQSPEQSVIEQVLERIEAVTQPIEIPNARLVEAEMAQSPPTCWVDSGVCVQGKPGVSSEDDATLVAASESSTSGRYHTPPRGKQTAAPPSGKTQSLKIVPLSLSN